MKDRISYEDLIEIKANDVNIKSLDRLNHAYRLNGIIDIYKNINKNNLYVLFDVKNTIYHRFERKVDTISFLKKFLAENKEQKTFSQIKNGKITYNSFVRNKEKSDWRPENYHWNTFKNTYYQDDLYFIQDGIGRIKIGRSSNVVSRIKNLQTANPSQLKVVFVIPNSGGMEKQFHNCFSELKLKGEWFTHTSRFDEFFDYVEANPCQKQQP